MITSYFYYKYLKYMEYFTGILTPPSSLTLKVVICITLSFVKPDTISKPCLQLTVWENSTQFWSNCHSHQTIVFLDCSKEKKWVFLFGQKVMQSQPPLKQAVTGRESVYKYMWNKRTCNLYIEYPPSPVSTMSFVATGIFVKIMIAY